MQKRNKQIHIHLFYSNKEDISCSFSTTLLQQRMNRIRPQGFITVTSGGCKQTTTNCLAQHQGPERWLLWKIVSADRITENERPLRQMTSSTLRPQGVKKEKKKKKAICYCFDEREAKKEYMLHFMKYKNIFT